VRTGDICLHCNDTVFWDGIVEMLRAAATQAGLTLKLHAEAQTDAQRDFFTGRYPGLTYGSAMRGGHEKSMVETACQFLTTDLLVTTGSSLPVMIAAFGQHHRPLVFEDVRKEAVPFKHALGLEHHLPESEAVWLHKGRLQTVGVDAVAAMIKAALAHANP